MWVDRAMKGYASSSNSQDSLLVRIVVNPEVGSEMSPHHPLQIRTKLFFKYGVPSFSVGKIAHHHITTDNGDLGHQIHDKMPRKGQGAGLFNHAASTNEKKEGQRKEN